MGIIKTVLGWASSAWTALFGAGTNPVDALTKLWHYITSVHDVLAWLAATPLLRFLRAALLNFTVLGVAVTAIRDVLGRLATWIWVHQVNPVRVQLLAAIAALRAWTVIQFKWTWALVAADYAAALAYTRRLTGIERAQRIQAVRAEAAARVKGDKVTLATVQQQAASAYNAGLHDRLGLIGGILDDISGHTPLIKDAVTLFLRYLVDLENVDDPALRWALNKAITEIVNNAAVDRAAGELAQGLLGPLIGQPRARGLHDVVADIAARLGALESDWAKFMKNGGPEVEQAGEQWKEVTGVIADVGLLAFVGLAVTDPPAWAQGVADTIGTVADGALTGIVDLIGRA